MTDMLKQAIDAIERLPLREQDAIASIILEEVADQERWANRFSRTQPQLDQLAQAVQTDFIAGRVRDMNLDEC